MDKKQRTDSLEELVGKVWYLALVAIIKHYNKRIETRAQKRTSTVWLKWTPTQQIRILIMARWWTKEFLAQTECRLWTVAGDKITTRSRCRCSREDGNKQLTKMDKMRTKGLITKILSIRPLWVMDLHLPHIFKGVVILYQRARILIEEVLPKRIPVEL